jgi:hypothetical protein
MSILGKLFIEAAVVGVICLIFLILFIVAGVRQKLKEDED